MPSFFYKFLTKLRTLFSDDLGIDLGTMNTLVCMLDKGIVIDEPSVVACSTENGRVIAVGAEAKRMLGRAPGSIKTYRPVQSGVIAQAQVTDKMMAYFIKCSRSYFKIMQPRVLVGVPYGITPVQAEAVINCAHKAGARDARLVAEPYAAALGAGLPVTEPTGNMVVDIGGGTTEVAMISLGCIETAESLNCGGDDMDRAIIKFMQDKHALRIGERAAEDIKKKIGIAMPVETQPDEMEVSGHGIDMRGNSLPRKVIINSNEIQQALEGPVREIIACVRRTIDNSQPALASDLFKNGIMLTGGGALLRGLDYRIQQETGIDVRVAQDPLKAVVKGTSELLKCADAIFKTPADQILGTSTTMTGR